MVPARSVGEQKASMKGNHDNPVSGNHPGTITLNTQWNIEYYPNAYLEGGEGREQSFFLQLHNHVAQLSQMVDINRGAVNLLRPCKTLGLPRLN